MKKLEQHFSVFFRSTLFIALTLALVQPSPMWNSIFAVNDCNATIERAETLGGCAIFVHTVPKALRNGSLNDSGGAPFVIRGPVP